jgi:nuclear factor related to kappa-B-binding protein
MNSERSTKQNEEDDAYDSDDSEATVVSSTNESINESVAENCEIAKILDQKFQLPKDLCENRNIFDELFSLSTWNGFSQEEKDHLSTFLPEFPENNEQERSATIEQFFTNQISRFDQTPLDVFHNNLQDGNYRPDIAYYRKCILKAEEREQRIRECERVSLLTEKLILSREKLLRSVYNNSPDVYSTAATNTLLQSSPKLSSSIAAMRGSKRYFQDISKIAEEANHTLSDDEVSCHRSSMQWSKKQIKQFNEQVIKKLFYPIIMIH